jgi:amino-acid N-acetyltransferase
MDDVRIRRGTAQDETHLRALLEEAQLPFEDVREHVGNFIVAEHNNAIVGTVGLQIYDEIALLRSLVVVSSYRNKGVGRILYDRIVAYARLKGVKKFYLLTTTAEMIFRRLGFVDIDRNTLPDVIRMTDEFQKLCPETAVCMVKDIGNDIYYVPQSMQDLVPSVPGARMLAVPLDKAMLTYFEISPGTRFERHKHESEQITFVIEGVLFFEIDDRKVRVEPGEVIAIPSNALHAAYTDAEHVRAVDAWSPARREFIQKT